MSSKMLFACSKCYSRHPFEELSSGQQLCKNCRGSTSLGKCNYCRTEYQIATKSQTACRKCEHYLSKYGKPSACESCKIVAAFGGKKCSRCAGYEAKYGPPIQCDECKLRSAFDKRDESKKINGKILCWLCTSTYKRTLLKAQEGRIVPKKRPRDKSLNHPRDNAAKSARNDVVKTNSSNTSTITAGISSSGTIAALDLPEKLARSTGNGNAAAPAVVGADKNPTDHMVALTNLRERIAGLEKRLQLKDKELLERDKLITELKGKNFENENSMRNKVKDMDRLHDMKVQNLNRKITDLLKEKAAMKRTDKKKKGNCKFPSDLFKQDNISPKEEETSDDRSRDKDEETKTSAGDDQDEKESVRSASSRSSSN